MRVTKNDFEMLAYGGVILSLIAIMSVINSAINGSILSGPEHWAVSMGMFNVIIGAGIFLLLLAILVKVSKLK